MRSHPELKKRLTQYKGPQTIYTKKGYIVWQLSTGENVEILFIEVDSPGHGHATELVKAMCQKIKPFNSVFVFRLASNERAGFFYRKLGFQERAVDSLYKVGAVLGVVTYEDLCRNLSMM